MNTGAACWAAVPAGRAKTIPATAKAMQKPALAAFRLLAGKESSGIGWQNWSKSICKLDCLRVSLHRRNPMTFARRSLLALGFTILLAGLAQRLCAAQPAP